MLRRRNTVMFPTRKLSGSTPAPVPPQLPFGRTVQTGNCVDLPGVQQFLSWILDQGGTVETLAFTAVGVTQVGGETRVVGVNGDPAGQPRQVPVFAVVAVVVK
jgi:hypothetical protein